MIKIKDKLISFPEEILGVLDEYKQKTGIPATDYIRDCVCRKMIEDRLIFIKTKYINVSKEREDNSGKLSTDELAQVEANKFCDGASCEIPALINKNC